MSTTITLLDTPKKLSLQSQSTSLRATLKDFERCFTESHGRKPKQNDIKGDLVIATKYKEYQRVQDVLAGKVAYEKLNETKGKGRTRKRTDSGIGSSPRGKQTQISTPRKVRKTKDIPPQDNGDGDEEEEILQPILLNAIGPTPHRDGKVLGLFDLLSQSGGSVTTPSTARKRKMEELFEDTPAKRTPLAFTQARQNQAGDLLDFLSGTPVKTHRSTENANAGRFSRTPQSEGKKFQLSQFFATPQTARVLFHAQPTASNHDETPKKELDTTGLDATPTYLRRSTSFKDRLLSASMAPGASVANESRRSLGASGPPTLRSFRSSTSNVLKDVDIAPLQSEGMRSNTKSYSERRSEENFEDEHDDELDVLRELEAEAGGLVQDNRPKVLVEDSQFQLDDADVDDDGVEAIREEEGTIRKPYKKKGQKRTTKRVNIKPMTQPSKPVAEPKFVAADGTLSDDDEKFHDENRDDQSDKENSRSRKREKGKTTKQAGTINPNAQSHTNYQRLKIRGSKGAKATPAGRGKFGRRK